MPISPEKQGDDARIRIVASLERLQRDLKAVGTGKVFRDATRELRLTLMDSDGSKSAGGVAAFDQPGNVNTNASNEAVYRWREALRDLEPQHHTIEDLLNMSAWPLAPLSKRTNHGFQICADAIEEFRVKGLPLIIERQTLQTNFSTLFGIITTGLSLALSILFLRVLPDKAQHASELDRTSSWQLDPDDWTELLLFASVVSGFASSILSFMHAVALQGHSLPPLKSTPPVVRYALQKGPAIYFGISAACGLLGLRAYLLSPTYLLSHGSELFIRSTIIVLGSYVAAIAFAALLLLVILYTWF